MRRLTGILTGIAALLGSAVGPAPAAGQCPAVIEETRVEREGFAIQATMTDLKCVTVTVTNTSDDELDVALQDWTMRIGYESSAALPVSVHWKVAATIVLDPVAVPPGESYTDELTMRTHRGKTTIFDLVTGEGECGSVVYVRIGYAIETGGELVKGAVNLPISYKAD